MGLEILTKITLVLLVNLACFCSVTQIDSALSFWWTLIPTPQILLVSKALLDSNLAALLYAILLGIIRKGFLSGSADQVHQCNTKFSKSDTVKH